VENGNGSESFWVGGLRGVFNHGLFPQFPAQPGGFNPPNLLVTPDELSALILQSACFTDARARGSSGTGGYVFACGLGALRDVMTVRAICRTPIVCYDNGVDGFDLVTKMREVMNVTAFRPPDAFFNLGAFLTSEAANLPQLADLVERRVLFTRPFQSVKAQVDEIRTTENKQLRAFQAHRWACDEIIADLRERGVLYHDGREAHIFLHDTKEVIPAEPDNPDFRLLMNAYGVGSRDTLYKTVIAAIDVAGRQWGIKTEVHSLAYYDGARHLQYVFDLGRWVYRISPDKVEKVDNGTDGVLFVRNDAWEPWELLDDADDVGFIADEFLSGVRIDEARLSRTEIHFLFEVWIYTLFFPELFPSRVICAAIGPMGSGKTTAIKLVGRTILGRNFQPTPVPNDPSDLDAAITNEAFVLLDNADKAKEWLEDRLAVAATGGSVKRRLYFTTNELVDFPIRAALALTSRTPHFRREDVADRLLIFNMERFEGFASQARLEAHVEGHRNRFMTRIVKRLPQVVAALRDQSKQQLCTKFRMADFGEFALKIGPTFGVERPRVETILKRMSDVQRTFSAADDGLLALLDRWLESPSNSDRWVSTAELYTELHEEAEGYSGRPRMPFEFRSVRQLGQRITEMRGTLEHLYAYREETRRSNQRFIRIRKPVEDGVRD
jgi:hypothetical protein